MIIGLTGQTGAGKSTVCSFLSKKNFCIIDCDKVSREVTDKGSPIILKLADAFGSDIVLEDGSLNRKLLAERAFCEKSKTELLNSITHPEIINAIKNRISECKGENIVLDAPTLFESGADKLCDKVIAVLADVTSRKNRIIQRDLLSCYQAEVRLSAQKDNSFFESRADAVLYNNGTIYELEEKTLNALKEMGAV